VDASSARGERSTERARTRVETVAHARVDVGAKRRVPRRSLVVAPFGAAVANVLAAPRGTAWLFLCPPTMCKAGELAFSRDLAAALGVSLAFLEDVGARADPAAAAAMNSPWVADVEKVLAGVQRARGARRRRG